MTTPLIITPGFYRTRDGRKAFAGFINQGLLIGYIVGAGAYTAWWHNGKLCESSESVCDLIAEWIDAPVVPWEKYPAWFQWVAMDGDKKWYLYVTKPVQDLTEWEWDGEILRIPVEHAPTFTGPWRNSLVQRPQPEGGE